MAGGQLTTAQLEETLRLSLVTVEVDAREEATKWQLQPRQSFLSGVLRSPIEDQTVPVFAVVNGEPTSHEGLPIHDWHV